MYINTIKHISKYIKSSFIFCKRDSEPIETDRVIYYDNIKHLTQTNDNLYHNKKHYNMTFPKAYFISSSISAKPKLFYKSNYKNLFVLLNGKNPIYKLSDLFANTDKNIVCTKQTNYLFKIYK